MRRCGSAILLISLLVVGLSLFATPAAAQVQIPEGPGVDLPGPPQFGQEPTGATAGDGPEAQFNLDLGDTVAQPSQSLVILLLLTLLAVAPSLLIMLTSFTRIVIVLSITRNAIGLPAIPPNQVVVGLAMFLSFFVMAPTLGEINDVALQPLLAEEIGSGEALELAKAPIREFMLDQVGRSELALFVDASGDEQPASPEDVSLTALIPAFVLSELKAAFIIGFVVFVPFLIIDLITASVLMSMGMMMLPPVMISLPFKLLLFVLVDGWSLVVSSLLESFT